MKLELFGKFFVTKVTRIITYANVNLNVLVFKIKTGFLLFQNRESHVPNVVYRLA